MLRIHSEHIVLPGCFMHPAYGAFSLVSVILNLKVTVRSAAKKNRPRLFKFPPYCTEQQHMNGLDRLKQFQALVPVSRHVSREINLVGKKHTGSCLNLLGLTSWDICRNHACYNAVGVHKVHIGTRSIHLK